MSALCVNKSDQKATDAVMRSSPLVLCLSPSFLWIVYPYDAPALHFVSASIGWLWAAGCRRLRSLWCVQQRRAGPVVLAGQPTREAPGQTVHAIFQQVPHPSTHASPCLTLLPAPSSTAMLASNCNGYATALLALNSCAAVSVTQKCLSVCRHERWFEHAG